jgi:fermentation-respiration switch protein FrsA (DUF1100 family)
LARRVAWGLARNAAILYLALIGILMLLENHLIFIPSKYPSGEWNPPGLGQEDAHFTADDGTKLHGWYVAHPRPRAVVLFCHGNAGNIAHRAELLSSLRDEVGVSALIFDYRGYGRSEGSPSEAGVLADARAARTWLAQRAGVPEDEVVVMGESLGGAVAVDLAASGGARALILENTFDRLSDVAAYHFPWLPVRWLLRTQLNSAEKIPAYRGPVLALHGDCDTIVPYERGRRLFEAANAPKEFVTLPGRDHNDPRDAEYYGRLRDFIERLPNAR